jgi:hypothetical protein
MEEAPKHEENNNVDRSQEVRWIDPKTGELHVFSSEAEKMHWHEEQNDSSAK